MLTAGVLGFLSPLSVFLEAGGRGLGFGTGALNGARGPDTGRVGPRGWHPEDAFAKVLP